MDPSFFVAARALVSVIDGQLRSAPASLPDRFLVPVSVWDERITDSWMYSVHGRSSNTNGTYATGGSFSY